MHRLELILLGSPRIIVDGRTAALTLRKALALLAYLACASRSISREELSELLWPDAPEGQGRARLRRTLYRLATSLGFNPLHADGELLRPADEVELVCDATRFESMVDSALSLSGAPGALDLLTNAAEIYGGDFMQGFVLPDCDQFGQWQDQRSAALRELQIQVLEKLVDSDRSGLDTAATMRYIQRLLRLEPTSETHHGAAIRLLIASGRTGAALAQYRTCERTLREELGVAPSPETRALVADLSVPDHPGTALSMPRTRYTPSGEAHIAYQVVGEGPQNVILIPGFVSHLEQCWMEPTLAEFLGELGSMCRLILLDRRGIGLSDRTAGPPTSESTAADIQAVMDAVGIDRTVIFGISEGGPMALKFAHERPERVAGLVLFGTMARGLRSPDCPWALDRAGFDGWLAHMVETWGGPSGLRMFAPSRADEPAFRDWWARTLRLGSSPGAMRAVLEALRDVDVRGLLAEIQTPALVMHREGDRAIQVEAGRQIATTLPEAIWIRLDGDDHWPWIGETRPVIAAVRAFLGELA